MPREILNPETLYPSTQFGFSHVAIGHGARTIHCAGQVAWDDALQLIGPGDLRAQIGQCLANLKLALAAAGATPADIVRLKTYLVGHDSDGLKALSGALEEFYGGLPPAPNTVIGVARLAMPDFLVEIEATASID